MPRLRFNNLLFQTFGKWRVIAIEPDHGLRTHSTVWRCQCECGAVEAREANALLNGKSSGCRRCSGLAKWQRHKDSLTPEQLAEAEAKTLASKRAYWLRGARKMAARKKAERIASGTYRGPNQTVDMSGKRCGEWTVVGGHEIRCKRTYWFCRCSCGTEKFVVAEKLRSGDSLRCRKCAQKIASTAGHKAQMAARLAARLSDAAELIAEAAKS